jgi:hypothetical protein
MINLKMKIVKLCVFQKLQTKLTLKLAILYLKNCFLLFNIVNLKGLKKSSYLIALSAQLTSA